jgi:hypothetical protein
VTPVFTLPMTASISSVTTVQFSTSRSAISLAVSLFTAVGGNVASRGPAVSEIGNGESANATDGLNAEPIDLARLNEQDVGASATPDAVPRPQSLWGDVAISAEVGGRSWLDRQGRRRSCCGGHERRRHALRRR